MADCCLIWRFERAGQFGAPNRTIVVFMNILTRISVVFLALQICNVGLQGSAHAQQIGSYVTPFPEKGTYRIYVFGGSLGNGIFNSLYGAFQRNADLQVIKKSKSPSGFVFDGWNRVAERITKSDNMDIAVVMFGANDRQALWLKKRRYSVGTKEWRAEYGRRVDKFIKTLKKKNVALYWVGLPIMKSSIANSAMQIINQIVREKVYLNGAKFIDTWNGFTDQDGGYSPFGPDMAGRVKKLRLQDGVHFTIAGYLKLAHYVEREIRRDISVAKAERSIPLAGDLDEQQRIITRKHAQKKQPLKSSGPAQVAQKNARVAKPNLLNSRRVKRSGVYDADHSKITLKDLNAGSDEQGQVIEILRPAIPVAVVNHINRRVSSLKASNVGESVNGPISGGLIATSSITPVSRQAGASLKRNVPITQTPYYRVLIKGAVLEPKPGRADDFRWQPAQEKPAG